eukprot:jgi/Mesvir1/6863/Mv09034-RA.1
MECVLTVANPVPSCSSVKALATPCAQQRRCALSSPHQANILAARVRNSSFRGCPLSLSTSSSPSLAQRPFMPAVHASSEGSSAGNVLLDVKGLQARVAEGEQRNILRGLDITVREGEIHAIMGKNGCGKSTFSKVLVGHPDYEVTGGSASFKGKDLMAMEPEERSHAGLFLSFQSPVEIPGVSNTDFLRMACNARRKAQGLPELDPLEFYGFLAPKLESLKMDPSFLSRNVNENFSGGEKKRNEILQLAVLDADLCILDEIDSGLDVDALRDVAAAVNGLKTPTKGVLIITHYQRLLDYIKPDYVHIMEGGRIVKTGDISLVKVLEDEGFAAVKRMK